MSKIAATAAVDKSVKVGDEVVIGPGCVVEGDVEIGDHCELRANVFIARGTRLGRGNRIFACCVLGEEPQILGLQNPKTELVIGDNNVFRENVTISRGSPQGGGRTAIGNDNFFMIGSHIGHDCQVNDHTVIGNYCQIGGHSKIENRAWLCANSGTSPFVTIGRYAYMGGYSGSTRDVPPFVRVSGVYPCEVRGVNTVGLQRAGMDEATIAGIEKAYRALYRRGGPRNLAATVTEMLKDANLNAQVRYFLESIQRSQQHRFYRYLETFRDGHAAPH